MRLGRIEEASAIAKKVGDKIASKCRTRLKDVDSRMDSKKMWDAVRKITGRRQDVPVVERVTAESLNQHYVKISTDAHYQQPSYKATATQSYDECQYMSEWNMFRIPGTGQFAPYCHWFRQSASVVFTTWRTGFL